MNNQSMSGRGRSANILFPMALFFAFAISALVVVLFAASVYKNTVEASTQNDTIKTALSYLLEKLHNTDSADTVFLLDDKFDDAIVEGIDEALVLKTNYNDASYYTFIYVYDESLCELLAKEGSSVSASAGTKILSSISKLETETLSDDLFKFTCYDTSGNSASQIVYLRSDNAAV